MKLKSIVCLITFLSLLSPLAGILIGEHHYKVERQFIYPDEFAAGKPYTPGILVDDYLYISGQIDRDPKTGDQPDGIADQTRSARRGLRPMEQMPGRGGPDHHAAKRSRPRQRRTQPPAGTGARQRRPASSGQRECAPGHVGRPHQDSVTSRPSRADSYAPSMRSISTACSAGGSGGASPAVTRTKWSSRRR